MIVVRTAEEVATPRDRGRLENLYAAHAPGAARLAYLLTGDRALAEDLVQDAFVRMFGRFRDLRHPEAFGAYLRKTVVNLAKSYFRRKGVERSYLERESGRPDTPAEPPSGREEMWDALKTLTPRQRAALVLRYYEDLTEAQVAELLGCSVGTVKSQTARGLATLRTVLGAEVNTHG